MRLAVIGPMRGNSGNLMRRLAFLFQELRPARIVYLDKSPITQALGAPFDGKNFWEMAAQKGPKASPDELLELVTTRSLWQRAQAIECLPEAGRTTDMLECGFVEVVASKTTLSKDEMTSASIVVFGDSARPLLQKLGGRLLVSPGPANRADGGLVLLSDAGNGTRVQLFDMRGKCVRTASLVRGAKAKLRVRGNGEK